MSNDTVIQIIRLFITYIYLSILKHCNPMEHSNVVEDVRENMNTQTLTVPEVMHSL